MVSAVRRRQGSGKVARQSSRGQTKGSTMPILRSKNTQVFANNRGQVQTPSRVTDVNYKLTGQHTRLPMPVFLPGAAG